MTSNQTTLSEQTDGQPDNPANKQTNEHETKSNQTGPAKPANCNMKTEQASKGTKSKHSFGKASKEDKPKPNRREPNKQTNKQTDRQTNKQTNKQYKTAQHINKSKHNSQQQVTTTQ